MKCSFCENDSKYSCNFIPQEGDTIIIQGCEEHIQIALNKQSHESSKDQLKQRMKNFDKGSPNAYKFG